jgi:hypothetical protein
MPKVSKLDRSPRAVRAKCPVCGWELVTWMPSLLRAEYRCVPCMMDRDKDVDLVYAREISGSDPAVIRALGAALERKGEDRGEA